MSAAKRDPPASKAKRKDSVEQLDWHAIGAAVAHILGWFPETRGLLARYPPGTFPANGAESRIDLGIRRLADVAAWIRRHIDLNHLDPGTPDGQAAMHAMEQLSQVVECCYASPKTKKFLPVFIAAIARTTSTANSIKAKNPRPRKIYLRDEKRRAQAANPGLTWKELLDTLEGDGIVTFWDNNLIRCVEMTSDGKEIPYEHATSTFRSWK